MSSRYLSHQARSRAPLLRAWSRSWVLSEVTPYLGEESIQIHLGDRATAALDTDQLGRRPLQVRGNLLLGQPALLSQTDELAAEKSALNNWSLISGHGPGDRRRRRCAGHRVLRSFARAHGAGRSGPRPVAIAPVFRPGPLGQAVIAIKPVAATRGPGHHPPVGGAGGRQGTDRVGHRVV